MFNVEDNIFYSAGAVLKVSAYFQFHYWNIYSPNIQGIKCLEKHFVISGLIFSITAFESSHPKSTQDKHFMLCIELCSQLTFWEIFFLHLLKAGQQNHY